MRGFNEAWRSGVVAQSLPDLTNGDFKHRFTDKCLGPYRVEKLLFCDELTRMPKKIVEHGESFGPDLYCIGASPEALIGRIQTKGIEEYMFCVQHKRRTGSYQKFMNAL
jgi:hypothetical protein